MYCELNDDADVDDDGDSDDDNDDNVEKKTPHIKPH